MSILLLIHPSNTSNSRLAALVLIDREPYFFDRRLSCQILDRLLTVIKQLKVRKNSHFPSQAASSPANLRLSSQCKVVVN